jgi:Bacteriophage HK97-gp10, putative tail-component
VTPAQLPVWLQAFADRARERAAVDAVNAMAHTYQRLVVASMHGPAPSPQGTPPARRTGTLARSIRVSGADGAGSIPLGGVRARATVAPHTVYARIQQTGGTIRVVRAKVLTDGRTFFGKQVTLPGRPYMVMPSQRRAACLKAGKEAALRAVSNG